ncbi:MAG TPA: anthranilate phosphoribosyltransferase, partial [Actinomycetota bacterium]|nr:anthranilate phosphoribosyltransferase [Actinomycetota bacterium]
MTQPDPDLWPHVLSKIAAGTSLDRAEAAAAMRLVMSGEATPGQVGGLLMALRTKGETVEEIEGLADTMLWFANPVAPPVPVVDTCGTGGDRSGTFNISTVAALVVAGAGVPVAKHGNRAASSVCGSADLLEALGVRIDLDATGVERCLAE